MRMSYFFCQGTALMKSLREKIALPARVYLMREKNTVTGNETDRIGYDKLMSKISTSLMVPSSFVVALIQDY
jgi:hypothetical protein